MKTRTAVMVVIGCVLAIGLSVWGEQEAFTSPLHEVLKLVPALATSPMISFTNWSLIKAYTGMESVTSESSEEERLALLQTTLKDQYDPSGYAPTLPTSHAEQWGFDKTDLAWEANILTRELPPMYVLKFRSGFDFEPLIALFQRREFVQIEVHGATLFTHELDLSAKWVRVAELGIHNTALIPEEHLAILSNSPGAVEVLLQTRQGELSSLSENPAAVATVNRLGETAGAMLLLGVDTCLGFTQSPLLDLIGQVPTEEVVEKLKALVAEAPQLFPYEALGVGYRTEVDRPIGRIVFHYSVAEAAAADLPLRQTLAEAGFSVSREAPYSEVFFTIVEAVADAEDLILTVRPANDQPKRLFQMVVYRDMTFAGCP